MNDRPSGKALRNIKVEKWGIVNHKSWQTQII
jgi:hypothetical protein